jgi:DNA mismatch repair protein MutL
MGRIRVLSDQVANQIAAGEVVERPASVVKELLENALDAGATRIRLEIEGGGRKLIRIIDDGCGMVRDDAILAFERHATSKIRSAEDLLSISTLGFRGEALPSIASVSRLTLATHSTDEAVGTEIAVAGGKMLRVVDAGLPAGTTISVEDLFYNLPARRKFLKSEPTELSHIAALVTHYALANPAKHFELHTASHALLIASPVKQPADRIYQIFGRDTLDQLLPVAAEIQLEHVGLPAPPPWKRDPKVPMAQPGALRLSGFVSKPDLQKLNRNSMYVFVNQRLIRDRLILHALTEAYRNILPPTSFPVVLLFLQMPPEEVDVNVHPAKTEVRFRQQSHVHDFVRDTIRNALMLARPAASFLHALEQSPEVTPALVPGISPLPGEPLEKAAKTPEESEPLMSADAEAFVLAAPTPRPQEQSLGFGPTILEALSAETTAYNPQSTVSNGPATTVAPTLGHNNVIPADATSLRALASLKPLGQLHNSFIIAVNEEGLWIIDQHVAHERILFEKVLRERSVERVQRQHFLMPLLIDLLPHQMPIFSALAAELERNGFEAEAFGPRTISVKAAPAGLEGKELETMLAEVLEQSERERQVENLDTVRARIAASVACHAAIKINTPLEPKKMDWLLEELAKTEHPTSCPHGRPIALRYSLRDIQRAFERV